MCVDDRRARLWEDRMMAGFMPLKENMSVQDTFAIRDFSKLSADVRPGDVNVCLLYSYVVCVYMYVLE